MPNRPICAEDALLSETPMPPEQILRYLDRIGLRDAVPPPPTLETLRRLQSAHLLYVPMKTWTSCAARSPLWNTEHCLKKSWKSAAAASASS